MLSLDAPRAARRRLALAALSGGLLVLSFPKFGHGAFAWMALAPLLVALHGVSPREGARLGYVTGAVAGVGLLYWTSFVIVQFGGLPLAVGAMVMGLLCLAVALFPALFGWLVARWSLRFGTAALLLAPVAWVATEMLRSYTFFRFAWCLLGYSQHAHLPFVQIASVTAVYGVSFLVALPAAGVGYAVAEGGSRRGRQAAAAALAAVVLAWGYGAWALRQPVETTGTVKVGLVQASIPQDQKWNPRRAYENIERHVVLTRSAASRGARFVVWPESAVPFYFDEGGVVAEDLQALASGWQLHLFFGNDDREPDENGRTVKAWVGAKMLSPEGRLAFRYHKRRLVPFGEYVPLQPLLTLGGRYAAKLVQQVADFTAGTEASLGRVDGHPVGAFICYEAIFPDLARELAAEGAQLLVNVTNDAWYGRTSAPHQHLAMAVFRAVENRRYLVRAANTGISAVVDPHGRVLERTALFEPALIVADVPFVSGTTFYARHGDVFGWTCLLAAAAFTAASFGRRGKRMGVR